MIKVNKRPYRSPLRAQQSAQSRRAVLSAAGDLFLSQGYAATTVEQIAQRAGVSKPTVFNAVGNKAQVLKTVRDVVMAGDDDPVPVTARRSVSAIAEAPDIDAAIREAARHLGAVARRYHGIHEVLRGAAQVDPEMAELWATAERERHVGAGHLLARLCHHARPVVTRARAQDQLWLLMAPDQYTRLVVDRGWTQRSYLAYVERAIRSGLFGRP
ncbi:MAG: TetR/AcrR family transcriptional regulator [Nocardioides sp.]